MKLDGEQTIKFRCRGSRPTHPFCCRGITIVIVITIVITIAVTIVSTILITIVDIVVTIVIAILITIVIAIVITFVITIVITVTIWAQALWLCLILCFFVVTPHVLSLFGLLSFIMVHRVANAAQMGMCGALNDEFLDLAQRIDPAGVIACRH